jgi:plasmid stability protein
LAVGLRSSESVTVRTFTVSVDDETHRRARVRAAELDTSVSALVRGFLKGLVAGTGSEEIARAPDGESALERRRRLLKEIFAEFDTQRIGLQMRENVARDDLYGRIDPGSATTPGDRSSTEG